MSIPSHSRLLRAALLLLLSVLPLRAQVPNILADSASFQTTILFSDVYSEKVVAGSAEPDPERISVFIIANLAGATIGDIGPATPVNLVVGDFEHGFTLGAAPGYVAGARSATFPLEGPVELPNGTIEVKNVGSVRYSWTDTVLTIKGICTDIETAELSDIAVSNYYGLAEPGTQVQINADPVEVSLTFGQATGARTARVSGVSKTVLQSGQELVSVNLKSVRLSRAALVRKHALERRALTRHFSQETRAIRFKHAQERREFRGTAAERRELMRRQQAELRDLTRHQRQEAADLRARQVLERREYAA